MLEFPEHITETVTRLVAERAKFHLVYSEAHGAYQVLSVDELRDVRFQGSLANCQFWVEATCLLKALNGRS